MSRRNIWLSFSEWELIRSELKIKNNNSFYLNEKELKRWKEDIEIHFKLGMGEAQHCFERVGIYPTIEQVTSPRAYNVLCRENWRGQDLWSMTQSLVTFVGFIVNYVDDVDMDTTNQEWDHIRHNMMNAMTKSKQVYWTHSEIVEVYMKVAIYQFEEQAA